MHSRHRNAFTLIELMIVIAVVIIMAAIGLPVLGNAVTERRIVSAAVQLQQDIRVVQEFAITRRVVQSISFNTAQQTYTYTLNDTLNSKTTVRSMTSAVSMVLVGGFSGTLWFDSFGSPEVLVPLSTTLTYLSAEVQIGFQTGSKLMIVAIQPVLGRVDTTWKTR